MLLGVNGFKGSGKDTVGQYLVDNYGFEQRSFAAPLKQSVANLFGISLDQIEEWKNNPSIRVEIVNDGDAKYDPVHAFTMPPIVTHSFRSFLQRYGTEGHRDVFSDDFWIEQAFKGMRRENSYVLTDARFENELTAIQELGGITIRIERDVPQDNHPSEVKPSEHLIDYEIINNGTLEQLYENVDSVIKDYYSEG